MDRSAQLKLMEAFWEELTPIHPQSESAAPQDDAKLQQDRQEHENWQASKHLLHKHHGTE